MPLKKRTSFAGFAGISAREASGYVKIQGTFLVGINMRYPILRKLREPVCPFLFFSRREFVIREGRSDAFVRVRCLRFGQKRR